MIYTFAGIIGIVGIVLVYAFWLRGKLREHPKLKPIYARLEPIEVALWDKSRTILLARLYTVIGFLITAQGVLASSGVDWLSLIPIPPEYAKYVGPAVWATGLLFAKMRKMTTSSLAEKREQN